MSGMPYYRVLIKPQVPSPASDKYSRYFYNWIKKKQGTYGTSIYCMQRSAIDGLFLKFEFDNAGRPDIYIGSEKDGDIYGSRIGSILIGDRGINIHSKTDNTIDISEWFWERYLRIGRCIFDKNHTVNFQYAESRYRIEGNTRICNWCNCKQEYKLQKSVVTIENGKYVNVAD